MIYQEVEKRCKARKMTISELERKAGLGNATIAGWRKAFPRIDKIAAVANVLGCTVDELIRETSDTAEETGAAMPAC